VRNLFLFLLLFTLFSVVIDEINAQEAIDACVNSTNGNTRILAPYSNSVDCRKSENPVSLSKNVGEVSKKVFVTSQRFSGYFVSEADSFADCADLEDGIEAADCICQELAESAEPPLDGSYKAWVSDSEAINSPVVRFVKSIFPYVRVDGMIVAENWIDLTICNEGLGGDECLDIPINID
jgi:hypothetical protein